MNEDDREYKLEDACVSLIALFNDMTNTILSIAFARRCSPERKRMLMGKLDWAKSRVERMPTSED